MLTRDKILSAGLEMVDREGPQSLTMRRLAQRLEVTATAIYHYFEGREDVLDAIVDHICAAIVAETPQDGDWTQRLGGLLMAFMKHASAHPTASVWAITRYAHRPPAMRIHEAILAVLLDAGFSTDDAVYIKSAVTRFCVGHLALGAATRGESWPDLPASQFPACNAARLALKKSDPAEQFRTGLDALLAGLAASQTCLNPEAGPRPPARAGRTRAGRPAGQPDR